MTRQKSGSENDVSLFPFLAVLLCAMGALIFLLIVTTSRIRSEAIARAKEEAHRPLEPVPAVIESIETEPPASMEVEIFPPAVAVIPIPEEPDPAIELRAAIAGLAKTLDERRRRSELQRRAVQAVQTRVRAVESEIKSTEQQRQRVRQRQDDDRKAEAAVQRAHAGVQFRLDRAAKQIKHVQLKHAQAVSKFAIVPFEGKTGTIRRPILIECTKRGLRFLPEDVLITEDHIRGFVAGYNPLLAGTAVLMQYWKNKTEESGQPEPYVLLVVRPGGAVAYYAARMMLGKLKQPTGYELLTTDQELALEPPDPRAQALLKQVLETMLAQREDLVDSVLKRRFGGSTGFGSGGGGNEPAASGRRMRFRRGPGGFVLEEIEPGPFAGGSGSSNRRGSGTGSGPAGTNRFQEPRRMRNSRNQEGANGFRKPGGAGNTRNQTADRRTPGNGTINRRSGAGNSNRGQGTTPGLLEALDGGTGGDQGRTGEAGSRNGSASGSDLRPPTANLPGSGSNRGGSSRNNIGGGNSPSSSKRRNTSPPSRRSKRRTWGLSGRGASIGFEREITIRVQSDRLFIGKKFRILLKEDLTNDELTETLLDGIDAYARTWGRPPDSFYWVPVIRFAVDPAGVKQYERLHGPLARWGLSSRVEYTRTAEK